MRSSNLAAVLGARRGTLVARQAFLLDAGGLAQEQVGQDAGEPRPQCDRTVERSAARTSGEVIDDPSAYVQESNSRSTRSGKRAVKRDCCATSRRAADQDDLLQRDLVEYRPQQCNIILNRQFGAVHITMGHSDAEPVIAHEGVALAHRFPELPKCLILPVEFNMADPPCRHDKRRPVAGHRVSDAMTGEWQESDLWPLGHPR